MVFCCLPLVTCCYQQQKNCGLENQRQQLFLNRISRRTWFLSIPTATATVCSILPCNTATAAAASSKQVTLEDPRIALQEAQETLANLLENWELATVDCTYADVPRELLEQKNKELLLEKASTWALFDKSVSVVSCKTSNRIVRDYLGVTGKGPLVGIDKKIRQSLEWMEDPDQLDDYLNGMCVGVFVAHSTYKHAISDPND
jgi:hypothetical protein